MVKSGSHLRPKNARKRTVVPIIPLFAIPAGALGSREKVINFLVNFLCFTISVTISTLEFQAVVLISSARHAEEQFLALHLLPFTFFPFFFHAIAVSCETWFLTKGRALGVRWRTPRLLWRATEPRRYGKPYPYNRPPDHCHDSASYSDSVAYVYPRVKSLS